MKTIILIVSLFLMLVTATIANANNGEMLWDMLYNGDGNAQSIAEAYITGSYEMGIELNVLCFTGGVTHDLIIGTVANYLNDYPAVRHEQASVVVGAALYRYFPCENNE